MMKAAFDRARAAIDFLEQHQLDPGVDHYALACAHVSGAHPLLSDAIAALTEGGVRLSVEDAARLSAGHLPGEGEVRLLAGRERQVRSHTDTLLSLTSDAEALTGSVGRDLNRIGASPAEQSSMVSALTARLAAAENDLSAMRGDIADLRARLHPATAADDRPEDAWWMDEDDAFLTDLAADPHGFALGVVSLDALADINERFGRSVGDNILRALGSTLASACEGYRVVRRGGNAFLVLMPGAALFRARTLLEDARDSMAARILRLRGSGDPIGTVTLSAGIAVGRQEPAEAVLERAWAGQRTAIAEGGNRVVG